MDVSDSALLADEPASFDVIFSHMVFEHLSDEQLASAAKNAFRLLKPGGTFGFVVTHPGKMTDVKGDLVTQDGPFITTAPWGGELHNWRRSNDKTIAILRDAGFRIEATEDIAFPTTMPDGLSAMEQAEFAENAQKYGRYPAIRLLVKAVKPL